MKIAKNHWWIALWLPFGGAALFLIGLAVYDWALGIYSPYTTQLQENRLYPELGGEWVMHPVDNPGDWLPNGLTAVDVNKDGYDDYVTNYEYRGLVRVAFHPGEYLGDSPWSSADVGQFANAESSSAGDLDGDGQVDVVVTHGVEHTREDPGVRILWGMGGPSYQWSDGDVLPSSMGGWHFLYIRLLDLDSDGDLDIIAGGRAARVAAEGQRESASSNANWAGIRWFANPLMQGGDARNLEEWEIFVIDAETKSGHGFEFGDLDEDGDLDMVNGNADWDTPQNEENVIWYENPGAAAITSPWRTHVIYQGSEFYGKEQAVIVDLDGDGFQDIVMHTEESIYLFRNQGDPLNLEFIRIEKHPAAQWRARALEVADLNQDGKMDIIGALIHKNGVLPGDYAAVFWMEQGENRWITHVIKWGDNFRGFGTFNGEKWDQLIPSDVDSDGDLDLVANVEEYNRLRSILAVVWFENPYIP